MRTSLSLISALMIGCTCLIYGHTAQSTASKLSPNQRLLDLVSVLNGVFATSTPGSCESMEQYLASATYRPVNVPALNPDWTVSLILRRKTTVLFAKILAISEDASGNIHMKPYQLVDPVLDSEENVDSHYLASLQSHDLTTPEDCQIVFKQLEKNVFMGPWPVCMRRENGIPPIYNTTLTCSGLQWDVISGTLPMDDYHFIESCGRYPLQPYMMDGVTSYESPCQS